MIPNQKNKIEERCYRIKHLFQEWKKLIPDLSDFSSFKSHLIHQAISCYYIIIITEEMRMILVKDKKIPNKYPSIPWERIIRIRNQIIHENEQLSHQEIYNLINREMNILEKEIDFFKDFIQSLVSKSDQPSSEVT